MDSLRPLFVVGLGFGGGCWLACLKSVLGWFAVLAASRVVGAIGPIGSGHCRLVLVLGCVLALATSARAPCGGRRYTRGLRQGPSDRRCGFPDDGGGPAGSGLSAQCRTGDREGAAPVRAVDLPERPGLGRCGRPLGIATGAATRTRGDATAASRPPSLQT